MIKLKITKQDNSTNCFYGSNMFLIKKMIKKVVCLFLKTVSYICIFNCPALKDFGLHGHLSHKNARLIPKMMRN